ncbi:hypothetical protein [Oxalicibacterium flavum]|uniref:hypothetical protein n=1 Tax=Oxalicibacterium flavum TaxID=179467 RepID=UPI00166E05B1|nr:hypothetical protein [Oxalicibacterium flavum]
MKTPSGRLQALALRDLKKEKTGAWPVSRNVMETGPRQGKCPVHMLQFLYHPLHPSGLSALSGAAASRKDGHGSIAPITHYI